MKNKSNVEPLKKVGDHEELILRDYLAIERTKLANERTLFAYIRTSLFLVTSGIGLIKLDSFKDLRIIGFIALSCSGFLLLLGYIRFFRLNKRLKKCINQNK